MKIIVDENIPFAEEAFLRFGDIILLNGRKIENSVCKDADILIVRSITNVDEELLNGSSIKFVGSATTGADHIDTRYLSENNIAHYIAAGCNAYSVVEYFFSAITHLAIEKGFSFQGKKLGVIGVGKIGSKVAAIGKSLGFEIIKNDPPLKRETGSDEYRPLEEALNADIITFHVPLNKTGIDKTHHMIDSKMLEKIRPGTVIVNSSRGSIIDNEALNNRLVAHNDLLTVIDVWENEPTISKDLLNNVNIGTAHIAGYSLEGKVNGTVMVYNELCKFLNQQPDWQPSLPIVENQSLSVKSPQSIEEILSILIKNIYDIIEDNSLLKKGINMSTAERGIYFDKLRKKYGIRREFNNYKIIPEQLSENIIAQLKALRFLVK